ncbi:hypothetical protein IFM89_014439 [Coptis chinensis]|uniref:Secreted protein n=1 Tax=Coptis chinensis TaxID=261450 RepID=A0A835HYG8_9MAGN|nr:hypothetical protein IFM89_014439 [Coptis chinensis]
MNLLISCFFSIVVKGVVCKKNVAHRRMTSKIEKPRFLVLGGALEYQRVTNHLSSFDTLLQQSCNTPTPLTDPYAAISNGTLLCSSLSCQSSLG